MADVTSTSERRPLDQIRIADREHWLDGPPHEEFARMRSECPVHWTDAITEYPVEKGFWSVTTADDVVTVSRDWETFSSAQGITGADSIVSSDLIGAMFIGMDPPRHDRLKALFQKGFTPRRIAEHEQAIREITLRRLDLLEGRDEIDIVKDLAQPVVSRVIGSFTGIPEDDDAMWAELMNTFLGAGDDVLNPEGPQAIMERVVPEMFEKSAALIAARREHPTDDLTSVLVHAEVDGERLEEHEIVMGFVLLMAAGNDSTKSTFCSAMLALLEDRSQWEMLRDDLSLVPSAVEEALRMFPAFAHFRRTATKDVELNGAQIKEGDKVVMWYASSNRDESRYSDPHRFDVTRNPEHQAFGGGGRHFCLGTALARLELRILIEETIKRFPEMQLAGEHRYSISPFANQLTILPVRLGPVSTG
jgi:cholest-4-en-3-one 26-monooxygenase